MIHILASREDFEFVRGNQTVRVPFNTTDPAGATTNTLARQSDIPDISAKRDKTDLAVYRTVAVDEWSIADGRTDILPLTPLDISASPPIGDGEMATAVWVEGGGSISSSDRPPIAIWRIRFTPAGPDSTGDYFVVGVYNPMNHALMRVYSTLFTSGRDYISDPDPASSEPPDELDFGTAADTPVLGTVLMKWRFYKAGVPYPVPDVSLATTNAVVSKSSLAALSGQALSDMATQKEVKIMVQTILSVLQNAARCVALALVVPALALDADTAWEDVPPTNKVKSVVEQFSPPPGNYVTVSNRAMNAVTTNANGTAEIYSRSHALFLRPEEGQIEWEGPDVTAYIGLPKRSGTFALTDDIPDTNGLFYVNKRATLPGGSAYYYGTMWKDGFYSVNLGFEFIATWCDYILPSPEYSEQSVYLASTNYVQKAVAAAATAATNYTHDATKNAVQTNSLGVISASLTIGDGLAVGSGATAYSDPEEGSGAFAHGYLSAATTYDAHAEGSRARAEAEASHAEGVRTTAGGEIASHAAGVRAHASHNASFVWQGTDWVYTDYATLPEYFSHGEGTFNINPVGGLAGFYIGDTNLSGILDEKRGLTNLVVYAADLKAPWYNNNPDYSPLTWNEDAKGWIFSSTTSAGTNSVTLSYATGVWSLHTTFIDGTGKTDTVEAPENATRLDFAYDVVLTRTIPVVATADTLAKASDISTNNPAFVSAVLAAPIAGADPSDLSEIGEYGSYGTVGAAILALIAGLAALKRRMGAAETSVAAKLDASSAAPAFNSAAPYDVGNYVTHDGTLYRCTTAVATPGEWNDENWETKNMTSPDATLDVTSAGRLRLVDTDGTVLWQQGYDLAAESSATLSCDKVNLFVFAATTVPAFDDTATYDVDERVTYGGTIYKCTTAVETAGAWTGATNWTEDPDTQAFTLPTAPSGKVGDLILDIDNSANTVAVEAKLTGFDEVENPTFSVVVQKGKNLTQVLTFAAGERAELYFTQTAFKVNNLPTWKLVKQVVENGGAA